MRENIFQLRVWMGLGGGGGEERAQADPGQSFDGGPEEKLVYF